MADDERDPQDNEPTKSADASDAAGSGASQPAADSDAESDEVAARMAADALKAVQAAINDATEPKPSAGAAAEGPEGHGAPSGGGSEPEAFALPSFGNDDDAPSGEPQGINMLSDVDLHVKIELGRTRMLVEDVLRLGSGSVVELDKLAGDPVDVFVNERLVARGEVLVLNDNFCIRVNEIIDAKSLSSMKKSQAKPSSGQGQSGDEQAA